MAAREAGPAAEDAATASDAAVPVRRAIRSFVLRQGRATEAQKRAFVEHWPRFGVDPRGAASDGGTLDRSPRDLDALFGRRAPRVLEIGFGNGEQMLHAAALEPARDHLGIEVHGPGVGRLLNGLAAGAHDNVRVWQHDAVEVLREDIADGALAEARIYFPDPWHKKKHHKRRLVNPAVVALLCDKLAPGGLLHLATDWAPYAEHMWDVLDAQPRLANLAGPRGAVPRPDWRRQTHFETRGQRLGHGVWDLLYRRC